MARLVGFEPTTHGFEDRYSDPLSYRRTNIKPPLNIHGLPLA